LSKITKPDCESIPTRRYSSFFINSNLFLSSLKFPTLLNYRIFAFSMPISKLNIDEFIKLVENVPIFDVRSPAEYARAHIPGAFSLPIFNNEERKIIGTAYKQQSREKAIKIGLDFFGRNMVKFVEEVEQHVASKKNSSREIGIHCWRGGMRSAAMAWLLDMYGFKVYLLTGGYKTYRHWVLNQLEKEYRLIIVGGYTGGNKTGIINQLKKSGEPAIDLENLAAHKGSAFGNLNGSPQPSQEHFENLLATELALQSRSDKTKAIWLEGESQRIGDINIPFVFFKKMRTEPLFFMDIPFNDRLSHILEDYGKYEKEKLIHAILRIKKRMGGLETKNAINALLEDDVKTCFTILLKYYDKFYLKSTLSTKDGERKITYVSSGTVDAALNTEKLIQHVSSGK
jgi:tRNA 2-selenouridine synthase